MTSQSSRVCDIKTRMYPDGRRGTLAGAYAHYRVKESPCEECAEAYHAKNAKKNREERGPKKWPEAYSRPERRGVDPRDLDPSIRHLNLKVDPEDLPSQEEWRDVEGFEGSYQVSSLGRARSLDRVNSRGWQLKGKILSTTPDTGGYPMFMANGGHKKRTPIRVHQAVARAFIGPRPGKLDVCHANGVRSDNRIENLRYDSRSENIKDAVQHGTQYGVAKTHCKSGHELGGLNSDGKDRECWACRRANATVAYHKDLRPRFQEVADIHYENLLGERKRMMRSDFPL